VLGAKPYASAQAENRARRLKVNRGTALLVRPRRPTKRTRRVSLGERSAPGGVTPSLVEAVATMQGAMTKSKP